jgi:dTMP kinase
MNKGIFIVFEGGEGSGKSTMLDKTYNWLVNNGVSCIKTREPGGIEISERIRNIILDINNTQMDIRTEALLYAAARRQHLVERIIPALQDGKVVLCDRFIESSLAYQGYARGLGIKEIYEINKFAIDNYMPDLTILFDIDPEIGLNRINGDKNREINRLDLEKLDFHNKVRQGYRILLDENVDRIKKVNAEKSVDEVFSQVKEIISMYLKN